MKVQGKKMIIHCSDSLFGNAVLIDRWHRKAPHNYKTIGYHFVICNGLLHHNTPYREIYDGLLESGRELSTEGAHCYGHNDTIGICLIGESGKFSNLQLSTLIRLILDLNDSIGITEICQHSDMDKKKPHCAGLPTDYIKHLNALIK